MINEGNKENSCSFCGKREGQVRNMIKGGRGGVFFIPLIDHRLSPYNVSYFAAS